MLLHSNGRSFGLGLGGTCIRSPPVDTTGDHILGGGGGLLKLWKWLTRKRGNEHVLVKSKMFGIVAVVLNKLKC